MEIIRQAIDANPNPTYVKDQQGKFILTNEAYASLHGMSVATLLETGEIDSDYSYQRDLDIINSGETNSFEEFYKLKSGKEIWFNTAKKVFTTSDGSQYILSVSSDITILKKALQLAEDGIKADKAEQANLNNKISTSLDAILGVAKLVQKGLPNHDNTGEYINTIISITEGLLTTLPPSIKNNLPPKEEQPKVLNQLENVSVLLVEDDSSNQLLALSHLESWKIKVDVAINGEEALLKTAEKVYDLILMDIQMPGIDGIEATKQILNSTNLNQNSPIIAFTANVLDLETEEYKQYGFTDYLFKPFQVSGLYQVVSKNIGRKTSYTTKLNSTTDTSDAAPLVDFSGLGNLAEDALFIQKMQNLFIDLVPKQLEQLSESVRLNEWDDVANLAHRLKSTYGNIKINGAADAMKKIEEIAREKKNFDQLSNLLRLANETTKKVVTHFQQMNPS